MNHNMNLTEILQRLRKIRIPLLIFACAIMLLFGTEKNGAATESQTFSANDSPYRTIEEEESRLEETLQMIDGAGKTMVLLSYRVSAQTEYVMDEDKTVLLSAGSGKQEALAARTLCPDYLGAVIVCEGGNDPKVQLDILEAVSGYTGLRTDQITVLRLCE